MCYIDTNYSKYYKCSGLINSAQIFFLKTPSTMALNYLGETTKNCLFMVVNIRKTMPGIAILMKKKLNDS